MIWRRDQDQDEGSAAGAPAGEATARRPPTHREPSLGTSTDQVAVIGPLVVIKGELHGSENLIIDGQVEGTVNLPAHLLTIGSHGKIKAQVSAKSVVIVGSVTGNVTATEKLEIRENGSVEGDITSPRVAIAEGAHFRGNIEMQQTSATTSGMTPATPGTRDARATASRAAAPPRVAASPSPRRSR